eukprot:g6804.t1
MPPKRRAIEDSASASSPKKALTAARHAKDFNGWWALDLDRSDTMEKYLVAMGMSEIPILAAVKAEKEVLTLQRFDLTGNGVTIRKRTRLGDINTVHVFGTEVETENVLGKKTSLATYESDTGALVITTNMPRSKGSGRVVIVEKRWVEEEKDKAGEHVMMQRMVLTNLESGEVVETNRYFTPSQPPKEPDEEDA